MKSAVNTARVLNQNSCGSASYCGRRGRKGLFLTNAHVAGTKIGRIVKVWVESLGQTLNCRVIMAAYSDRTLADWAVLETVNDWNPDLKPVKLSKKQPSGSHYTKGFPRCQQHNGTDIRTVQLGNPWRWRPNAIGGQSGSAVWSDTDNLQYGLLTWSWGGDGAGQMTSEIYRQARGQTTVGHAKPDGLEELHDFDFPEGIERSEDDPVAWNGFYSEMANITDLEIWAEDEVKPPPVDPKPDELRGMMVEYHREAAELHEKWRKQFEGVDDTNDNQNDNMYGMGDDQ